MNAIDHDRMEAEQRDKVFQELRTRMFALECELAEYKQRAEAAEAKLIELEMQEPVGVVDEIYLAPIATGEYRITVLCKHRYSFVCGGKLYAKPFPAPKQEEK